MKFLSHSLEETAAFTRRVAAALKPHEDAATVLALYGELGSGKTAFTSRLCGAFGIEQGVQSPTFVLMKRYVPINGNFSKIIHIDAYRLEKPEELAALSFVELLTEPKTLIIIEWADRVEPLLPTQVVRFTFRHVDEATREIESPFS